MSSPVSDSAKLRLLLTVLPRLLRKASLRTRLRQLRLSSKKSALRSNSSNFNYIHKEALILSASFFCARKYLDLVNAAFSIVMHVN